MNAYLAACHGKTPVPSRRTARRRARHLGHAPGYATYLRPGPHGPIPVQEIPL